MQLSLHPKSLLGLFIIALSLTFSSLACKKADQPELILNKKPVFTQLSANPLVIRAGTLGEQADTTAIKQFIDSLVQLAGRPNLGYAYGQYELGKYYFDNKDTLKAGRFYQRSVQELQALDSLDLPLVIKLHKNIANIHVGYYEYGKALEFVDLGVNVYHEYVDAYPEGEKGLEVLIDLVKIGAETALDIGDLKLAGYYSDFAQLFCEQPGAPYYMRFATYNELACQFREKNQIDSALYYLEYGIKYLPDVEVAEFRDDTVDLHAANNTFYSIYDEIGDNESAARMAQQNLDNLKDHPGWMQQRATSLNNLGRSYIFLGRYAEAEAALRGAAEQYQELNRAKELAQTHENFGILNFYRERYNDAVVYFQRALRGYYGRAGIGPLRLAIDKVNMREPLLYLAEISCRQHEQDPLLYPLEEVWHAIERVDSLNGLLRFELTSELSKRNIVQRLRPYQEDMIDFGYRNWERTGEQAYLDLALHFVENSKGQILQERKAITFAQASQREGAEDQQLRQLRLNVLQAQQNYNSAESKEEGAELIAAQSELETYLRQLYPDRSAEFRLADRQPLSYELVQRLDANEVVLDYFLGEETVYVGVCTSAGVDLLKLPIGQDSLSTLVERFRTSIEQNPSLQAFNRQLNIEAGFDLYQALLAPVLKDKSYRKLTIIPDGILNDLPFSGLPTATPSVAENQPRASVPFLVLDYDIRLQHSMALLLEEDQDNSGLRQAVLFIGPEQKESITIQPWVDNEQSVTLSPLTYGLEEEEQIAEHFNTVPLSGREADRSSFGSAINGQSLIHFAGHGLVNPQDVYRSFLAFNWNNEQEPIRDLLFLDDLDAMQLDAELLVLSACETASGELSSGEGNISLSRAAVVAGAESVVATYWLVNQEFKATFFGQFYEQLAAGASKDTALCEAQRWAIRNSAAYTHPYYWAAFSLTGHARPIR